MLYLKCKYENINLAWNSTRLSIPAIVIVACVLVPVSSGRSEGNGGQSIYVGSEACKDCHPTEYESFVVNAKKSGSFKSIERLRRGLTDEEIKKCYSCHTTGYGKPGGFIDPETTPHLKNAGCEVCHGPGEAHVKTTDPEDTKGQLSKKDCEVCHISERVKAFRYKPMIHGGAH
jgi:hypothetical protein